jgi:hypothetical protein
MAMKIQVIPKYLNFAIFSNDLLVVFVFFLLSFILVRIHDHIERIVLLDFIHRLVSQKIEE